MNFRDWISALVATSATLIWVVTTDESLELNLLYFLSIFLIFRLFLGWYTGRSLAPSFEHGTSGSLPEIRKQMSKSMVAPKPRAVYAVIDTTFAVVDQGARAVDQLLAEGIPAGRIHCYTVPGFKDLGPQAQRALAAGADIAICCGMAGADPIDTQCAQDASFGMQLAQIHTGKPVLEVIVHMNEASGKELVAVVDNRVREHATNAVWMMQAPHKLSELAGTGQRQGFDDVGSIE